MKEAPLTVHLTERDRPALEAHFIALGADDRRLRFGSAIGDDGLRAYVARIDFERDGIFTVQDDDMQVLAVVHVAVVGPSAELGLSVLPELRGKGMGSALFARAVMHLRNRGLREVFVHCITENAAMMHLARKHGMRMEFSGSESDARLVLEPPTAESRVTEWLHESHVQTIQAVRKHSRFSRALMRVFSGGIRLQGSQRLTPP